jgi:hypothetical protein
MNSGGKPDVAAEPRMTDDVELGIYRDGLFLVMPAFGANLPMRCVLCNGPAHQRVVRELQWHPPVYYLLAIFGPPLYLIAYFFVLRRARVELPLCARHAWRQRTGSTLCMLALLAFAAAFIACTLASVASQPPYIVFMLGCFGSLTAALFLQRVVVTHRISDQRVWLRVGRPFLDSF